MSSFEVGTTDASAAAVPVTKGAVVVLVIGMAGMSSTSRYATAAATVCHTDNYLNGGLPIMHYNAV